MRRIAIFMLIPLSLFAQQLVYTFSPIDTTQYDYGGIPYYFCRDPLSQTLTSLLHREFCNDFLSLYHKKNSEQYDIFSFTGKVGSITVHKTDIPSGSKLDDYILSQTLINSDLNWEYIANYWDTTQTIGPDKYSFKVFDGTGNQLLSDSGTAFYGFDGQNTYVISTTKVWRFRTNIGGSVIPSLPKAAAGMPGPIMALMPSGDLRVDLKPAGGGRTSLQIFDMLGRQVFSKIFQNLNTPATFMIPSSRLPQNPFIAKIANDNGTFLKKEIPAH